MDGEPGTDPIDAFDSIVGEEGGTTVLAIFPADVPEERQRDRWVKSDFAVSLEGWR